MLQDHILRDNGIYDKKFDIDRALDGLRVAILVSDLSLFTGNDIVHPKERHVLASYLFSKSV